MRKPILHPLPDGFVYHCERCSIVIPAEAPRVGGQDCVSIAETGLAWFNPRETIAGQFCMAAAAWELIHHQALQNGYAECVEYMRRFRQERKQHFAASAARNAMPPERVRLESMHRRDAHLYR